jgi:hypothetical protein
VNENEVTELMSRAITDHRPNEETQKAIDCGAEADKPL